MKKICVALLLLAAVGIGVGLIGWWKFLDLRIRVALAEEQTRYFQEMIEQGSRRRRPAELDADIEGVRIYYPSGTKQKSGSHLNLMVERARDQAVANLESRRVQMIRETQKQ